MLVKCYSKMGNASLAYFFVSSNFFSVSYTKKIIASKCCLLNYCCCNYMQTTTSKNNNHKSTSYIYDVVCEFDVYFLITCLSFSGERCAG